MEHQELQPSANKHYEYARLLFMELEDLIRFGDSKAQLTLGVNAILLGASASIAKSSLIVLIEPTSTTLMIITGLLVAGLLLSMLLSILFALNAAQPTKSILRRWREPRRGGNLFFHGYIQSLDPDEFISTFKEQTDSSALDAILIQVHAKSRIAHRKFNNNRHSMKFLYLAFLFWVTTQVLLAFQA